MTYGRRQQSTAGTPKIAKHQVKKHQQHLCSRNKTAVNMPPGARKRFRRDGDRSCKAKATKQRKQIEKRLTKVFKLIVERRQH